MCLLTWVCLRQSVASGVCMCSEGGVVWTSHKERQRERREDKGALCKLAHTHAHATLLLSLALTHALSLALCLSPPPSISLSLSRSPVLSLSNPTVEWPCPIHALRVQVSCLGPCPLPFPACIYAGVSGSCTSLTLSSALLPLTSPLQFLSLHMLGPVTLT